MPIECRGQSPASRRALALRRGEGSGGPGRLVLLFLAALLFLVTLFLRRLLPLLLLVRVVGLGHAESCSMRGIGGRINEKGAP